MPQWVGTESGRSFFLLSTCSGLITITSDRIEQFVLSLVKEQMKIDISGQQGTTFCRLHSTLHACQGDKK